MNSMTATRGRVLSGQQIRFNQAPVRVGTPHVRCAVLEPTVSVRTDPATGDLTAIEVRCACGEVIVVECSYANESLQQPV